MVDQAFLNNAQAILIITNDEWTKTFVKSLLDQVKSGRSLSEKQMAVFNKKLESVFNVEKPTDEASNDFLSKVEALRNKTKSQWLLGFLKSLEDQVKSGKALTEKQGSIFKSKYDRLVLKIKPSKEETEEEPEEENP